MALNSYRILLGGNGVEEQFYRDVMSLSVEESTTEAGVFSLRLVSRQQDDGSWGYVDDTALTLFSHVLIQIGFVLPDGIAGVLEGFLGAARGDAGLHTVFNGFITSFRFQIGADARSSFLEIKGIDASVLLSLEEKVATWPNLSDSDIAGQIVANYHIPVHVDTTSPQHQEADNTVIQRGTDLQFVRELARRNGLEFFFETDDTGAMQAFFRAPKLDGSPQPDLAAHFGDETNLKSFSASVVGLRPLNVKMQQMDIERKTSHSAQAASISLRKLGDKGVDDLVAGPLNGLVVPKDALAQTLVLGPPTSDSAELTAIVQSVRNEAGWFINATGEINSDAYQGVLRPRRTVLVKGTGTSLSGKYYVTRVSHEVKANGSYSQTFEARRNAQGLDNTERFGGGGVGLSTPAV